MAHLVGDKSDLSPTLSAGRRRAAAGLPPGCRRGAAGPPAARCRPARIPRL